MKTIPLGNGSILSAIVSDEDYDYFLGFRWLQSNEGYVWRWNNLTRRYIFIHTEVLHRMRFIREGNLVAHHKDELKINNQRSNLMYVTPSFNQANRRKLSNNSSGFKGVSVHTTTGKWAAQIRVNYHLKHLGLFDFKEDAAKAYNQAAKLHFGEMAYQNPI